MNQWNRVFATGSLLAGLAIVTGAFGAHGLERKVSPEALETFEIGVRYQMYAALGLIGIAAMFRNSGKETRLARIGCQLLFLGTLIFSGTLYGIVAGGPKWLGAITPIGGSFQIIGWFLVSYTAMRQSLEI